MTNVAALRIRDDARLAGAVVAPSWPLSSTVAVNPLSGYEDRPYEEALASASVLFGTRGHLSFAEYRAAHRSGRVARADLEAAVRRRLGSLADDDVARIVDELVTEPLDPADDAAPARALLTVAEEHDQRHGTTWRRRIDVDLTDLLIGWTTGHAPGDDAPSLWDAWRADGSEAAVGAPDDPALALLAALERLRVPAHAQRAYLERHVAALAGWVAHLRWRELAGEHDVVLGFLAASATTEAVLVGDAAWFTNDGPPPRPRRLHPGVLSPQARAMVWQDAYERAVHDPILAAIAAGDAGGGVDAPAAGTAEAQIVCCIDVRSEGLRRAIEATGPYETFGYAGFFGLAARFEPLGGGEGSDRCPVIVSPGVTLREVPEPGRERRADALLARRRADAAASDAWEATTHHPIAPLALAEAAGWIAGPLAAVRTAMPVMSSRIGDRIHAEGARHQDRATVHQRDLPVEQQAAVVSAMLGIGLAANVAPLVVVCGHGSRADNNPLEAGLACGACGGHEGGPSARAVVAMANDPEVRSVLAATGRSIPAGTWFVAAEHDTSTDEVRIFDRHLVPPDHWDRLAQLERDLDAAGAAATAERALLLPGETAATGRPSRWGRGDVVRRVRGRGRDWAEPVAELGLAGNLAMVIGPRSLTAGVDLGRRAFLHSYDAALDPEGTVLGGILTAPLVVGQWINAQYNLSTTDPEVFGSGSKVVHNVLGDVGVLSGPGGDLRRGLPVQSVRDGDRLLHEPVRLMAIVQGDLAHIDAALAGSAAVHALVANGWIHLVARAAPGDPWMQRTADGWVPRSLDAAPGAEVAA